MAESSGAGTSMAAVSSAIASACSGRQLPPNPGPGCMNEVPIRSSRPTPSITVVTSAPIASAIRATSLAYEIFIPRNTFERSLIRATESASATTVGAPSGA